MQKSRDSENMQNALGSQTNPQSVQNSSLSDKLISGSAMWYHGSIISVQEYGEGEEDRIKICWFEKILHSLRVSADYLEEVKKYFPLQLLGYFLQHVLSEDLKAFFFLR